MRNVLFIFQFDVTKVTFVKRWACSASEVSFPVFCVCTRATGLASGVKMPSPRFSGKTAPRLERTGQNFLTYRFLVDSRFHSEHFQCLSPIYVIRNICWCSWDSERISRKIALLLEKYLAQNSFSQNNSLGKVPITIFIRQINCQ